MTFMRADGKNCAIMEQTGDGRTCGRCWYYVGDNDVCPRHGDVSKVMQHFRTYGKLTLKQDHKKDNQQT